MLSDLNDECKGSKSIFNIIWFFSTFAWKKLKISLFFFPGNCTKIFIHIFPSRRFYYSSAALADNGNLFQNVFRKTCFVFENVFHFFPGALDRQHGVEASLKTAHSSIKKCLSELSALHFTACIWRCCIGFDSIDTGLSQTTLVHCLSYSQAKTTEIVIFNKILIGIFSAFKRQ